MLEHRPIRGDDVCTESDVQRHGCAPRGPLPHFRGLFCNHDLRHAVGEVRVTGPPIKADRSNEPDQKLWEALDVVARAHKGGPEALKARAFARKRLTILQPRLLVGGLNDETMTPNEILTTPPSALGLARAWELFGISSQRDPR
jgi:hypothetical protein